MNGLVFKEADRANCMYQTPAHSDPLTKATAEIIASEGLSAVRSREIARLSGESAASINRRFGSQDALVREAMIYGTQQECGRLEHLIAQLQSLRPPEGFYPDVLIAVLNETHFAAPEAAAFRWTVFAHEDSDLIPSETVGQLSHTLDALWGEVAQLIGSASQDGLVLRSVLEGFARGVLITQNPLIFRGWTHELCRRLIARLHGDQVHTDGPSWRDQLVARANEPEAAALANFTDTKATIVEAAAACLVKMPLESITHRSIANEAGVSLSSMTHHFRSLEEILWFGCLRMITQLIDVDDGGRLTTQTHSISEFADGFMRISNSATVTKLDRLEQIQLYCHHKESFRDFGDQFLLRQGQNSAQVLANISDFGDEYDRLDAAILHHCALHLSKSIRRAPHKEIEPVTEDDVVYTITRIFGPRRKIPL